MNYIYNDDHVDNYKTYSFIIVMWFYH